jgi:hypothetical protein
VKLVYEKKFDGLTWIVDIQRSHWDDAAQAQFTLNCGVFIPGVTSLYLNRPDRIRIDTTDCCVHVRIGMLAKDKLDKWWELRADDNVTAMDREIGKEVSDRLTQHVLPFFTRFQTPEQVLRFLTNPRTKEDEHIFPEASAIAFCYAAALASLLRSSQSVEEFLARAVKASQGSPIEDIILGFRNRLHAK